MLPEKAKSQLVVPGCYGIPLTEQERRRLLLFRGACYLMLLNTWAPAGKCGHHYYVLSRHCFGGWLMLD